MSGSKDGFWQVFLTCPKGQKKRHPVRGGGPTMLISLPVIYRACVTSLLNRSSEILRRFVTTMDPRSQGIAAGSCDELVKLVGSVFQTSPAETGRQGLGLASPIGSGGPAFPGSKAGTLSSFRQGQFVVDLQKSGRSEGP